MCVFAMYVCFTCFPRRAPAVEAADAVDARGAVETRRPRTIVDVHGAIGAGPAIDADARMPADTVRAGSTILTHGRTQ